MRLFAKFIVVGLLILGLAVGPTGCGVAGPSTPAATNEVQPVTPTTTAGTQTSIPTTTSGAATSTVTTEESVDDDWDWQTARDGNTIRAIRAYLTDHPSGGHAKEARSTIAKMRVDDSLFFRARRKGFNALKAFIKDYPGHRKLTDARVALKRLMRAKVVMSSPSAVRAEQSRYSWDTTFRETRGVTGFKLKSTNFYIRDPSGRRWSNSWYDSVKVAPGGEATINYWCDKDRRWAGGTFHAVWVGKDGRGHRIRIVQEVRLKR